jgi:hypothetical protein
LRLSALAALLLFFTGCSKNLEPEGATPRALLDSLSMAETFDEALLCYSSETRKAVRDVLSLKDASKSELLPLLAFLKGALDWEIRGEKITGERAKLEALILDHVIDNMAGFAMPCEMLKENGKWRLDMKENILSLKGSGKKSGEYLDKKLKEYR